MTTDRYLPGTTTKNPNHVPPGSRHVKQETAREKKARKREEAEVRHANHASRSAEEQLALLIDGGHEGCREATNLHYQIERNNSSERV